MEGGGVCKRDTDKRGGKNSYLWEQNETEGSSHFLKYALTFQGLKNLNFVQQFEYTNINIFTPPLPSIPSHVRTRTCTTLLKSVALRKDEKALVL